MPETTGYQGYEGYGSLDWRRRIALEMMKKQQAYPKNVGEGIASAGGSLADALIAKQQREAEREYAGYEGGVARGLPPADTPYAPRGRPAAPIATPTPSMSAAPTAGPNYFASFPNSLNEQEDLYGNTPSFNDASEGQPAPVPTEQPAATGGSVPLPPRRPVYDRNAQIAELQDNPELTPRLLAMAKGEVGNDPAKQRVQLETAFNRAAARGQPLSQILLDTGTNNRLGYYPPETFTRGQASPDVLTDVLRGSDEGGTALGFAPTGNASGGVASRGIASGRYGSTGRLGDETYVTQETPAQLARLEASRVPGAPLNILPQAAGGPADVPFPSIGGLPAATPGAGRNALAAAMVPSPAPLAQTAALPATTATDAAPERSALPPDATAQVQPKNPVITTDAIRKAPELLPSQEPIPQAAPPYVTEVPPAPKRPQPLGMSEAQARAHAVMNDPRLDPQGAAVRRATQVYNFQEGLRKELETQQQAEFTRLQGQRDAIIVKKEQRDFEEQGKILKEYIDRVGVEKAQADIEKMYYDRGLPRQQAAEKAALDIAKARQEVVAGKAPEVMSVGDKRFQWDQATGGYKDITPNVDPSDIKMTEKQMMTLKFFERATFANQQLRKADNVLAGFMDTKLGATPVIGNYLTSAEYQKLDSAREAWGQAVLRDESGAVLAIPEIRRKLSTYFAVPGDRPETIRDKALRRSYEERSLLDSLGNAKPVADQFLKSRETRKVADPNVSEGEVQQSSKGRKRVNIGGYWEDLP